MNGLDAIKARAKAYAEYGTPGLAAPKDRAELLSVVDQLQAKVSRLESAAACVRAQTADLIADGMQSWAGDSERSYVQGFAEAAWGKIPRE